MLNMLHGMDNKGHVVVINNYFTSINLFEKLLEKRIHATSTVKNNHVGLPCSLCNTKEFHKNVHKHLIGECINLKI